MTKKEFDVLCKAKVILMKVDKMSIIRPLVIDGKKLESPVTTACILIQDLLLIQQKKNRGRRKK